MATLELRQLRKAFPAAAGEIWAVRDLDLELGPDEFLTLVGPSGCGKSTTLRLIAGLEKLSGGDILWDGETIKDWPPEKRQAAMVFQNARLFPHLTVAENIELGLKLRRVEKTVRRQRVHEAVEMLALTPWLNRLPESLSGGEQQRVALARALALQPKIFLLDEPFSNLDLPVRRALRQELLRLRGRFHATCVFVTHDQAEAMALGGRIALMKSGRIEQVDFPRAIYDQPASLFAAEFFGSPPMNLLHGRWAPGAGECAGVVLANGVFVPLPAGSKAAARAANLARHTPVVLAIRPEDLRIARAAASEPNGAMRLAGEFQRLEFQGALTWTHICVGDDLLIGQAPVDLSAQPGDSLKITVASERVHFFVP